MNTQELFAKMEECWNAFSTNHKETKKVAHKTARKAASELKKLIAQYNKASVSEDKAK